MTCRCSEEDKMGDFLKLLLSGDLTAWAVLGVFVAAVRMIVWVIKEPEVAPDGLVTDWDIRGQVAGIDWNAARTFGYLPMSQHVIIAESELAKGLAGSAIFREGIAMPPQRGTAAGLRKCDYCGTWSSDAMRMSCEKCGAPLIPSAPKPVEWPGPTTPGWIVR
jgi:hypothetical protein